jgi:hypothetical protein
MDRIRALRFAAMSFALGVSAALAVAADNGQVETVPAATQNLLNAYPGTHLAWYQGRVETIYGMPMTSGVTAADAAQKWIDAHLGAFGVAGLQAVVTGEFELMDGKFTSFDLKQYVGATPVEFGLGRILVLNGRDGQLPRVVYAAGRWADTAPDRLAAPSVTPDAALRTVQGVPEYAGLTNWTDAELVVYYGEGDFDQWMTTPVYAWKFTGSGQYAEEKSLSNHASTVYAHQFTFFVDAATGQLLFGRDDIHHVDVTGSVKGWGTPGVKPDVDSNPEVIQSIGQIRAAITGGGSAFADLNGNFVIPHGGSSAVSVTSTLATSEFFTHSEQGGTVLSLSLPGITPPGPANFVFNDLRDQTGTAQVNAHRTAVITRNYYRTRVPGRNLSNIVINTSVSGTCNAFYQPPSSINFYRVGGGCVNSAYSTVVSHEYGHHIVNQLNLSQGAFGEGFSDSVAIMIFDTGIIAEDFYGPGQPIRNPETANQQYPCSNAIHTCGQVLGGFWREYRNILVTRDGLDVGLETARAEHAAWSNITTGGQGSDAFHPTSVIQVLTIDDTDGNINNGTPNYFQICNAANQHGIQCPELQLLSFIYPDGRPAAIVPGQPTALRVNIVPITGTPIANTGRISYRVNGGSFTTVPMLQGNPNEYTATIPAMNCLDAVDYYITATAVGGIEVTDPKTAPTATFATSANVGVFATADVTFEAGASGFARATSGDTATSGVWEFGNPVGTQAQPEDDHTIAPGVNCWFTGNGPVGGQIGAADVDGGKTTLLSPIYDMGTSDVAIASYWRWYDNSRGSFPNADTFLVDVSNDGGTTWHNLETIGPDTQNTGGWIQSQRRVDTVVPITSQMRFRFVAQDLDSGSIVEAAIDDFKLTGYACGGDDCTADFNGDNQVDFFDYLDFAQAFNDEDPSADFNGDNQIDFFDYLDFAQAFDAGC